MINCSILTMIQVYFLVCIALFFQQSIHFTEGGEELIVQFIDPFFCFLVTCASNPCNLVSGLYDGTTGYCCYDVPPYYTDFVCACPNSAQTFLNRACGERISHNLFLFIFVVLIAPVTPNQGVCTKNCVNGGVCNIVNNQQVCWCQLGFSGANCEIQGRTWFVLIMSFERRFIRYPKSMLCWFLSSRNLL